jgi:hypothetical protein
MNWLVPYYQLQPSYIVFMYCDTNIGDNVSVLASSLIQALKQSLQGITSCIASHSKLYCTSVVLVAIKCCNLLDQLHGQLDTHRTKPRLTP